MMFTFLRMVLQNAFAVVFTLLVTVMPTIVLAQSVPTTSIAAIIARNELRVALPAFDSPPFFYADNENRLHGFDVNLARAIGRELGVPVRFDRSAQSFDEVVAIVARGQADVAICKLSRTLRRARDVRFTDPYVSFRHALVVNRVHFAQTAEQREPLEVIHDYRGTLGVIAHSSFADYARINFPNAAIQEFPSWSELVAAVQSGTVIAAYRDEFEIKKMIIDDPALSLTLRTITLTDLTDTIGIAAAAGTEQLIAFLNMYLSQRVGLKSANDMLALTRPSHAQPGVAP